MTEPSRTEQFLRHYAQGESQVYAYVRTLLPRRADADEVFSETLLALWQAFDQFESGTNFNAWACRVAYHRALKFRREQNRAGLYQDDEFFQSVAAEAERQAGGFARRLDALDGCLQKLRDQDRELLKRRYETDGSVRSLADELSRPLKSVYKSLERIRQTLLECIQRAISAEDRQ